MDKERPTARDLQLALQREANPEQAKFLLRFFKTGKGEYAEGDLFIGIKVPVVRGLVRQFKAMAPKEAQKLVRSEIHEHRLAGLLLWVHAFEKGDQKTRTEVFDLYLGNTRQINNWDLVDLSAPQIVGGFLPPEETTFLETLAESSLLWERRIAVLATFAYIRRGIFAPTLLLCEKLLQDQHDLMHKACGWMLREVGKRDRKTLEGFLKQHCRTMPRTMLRYAIEHFDEKQRKLYMAK
jgi:3-methyladenine DNA glycosylase AlkD